jgi:hypothetical protein
VDKERGREKCGSRFQNWWTRIKRNVVQVGKIGGHGKSNVVQNCKIGRQGK